MHHYPFHPGDYMLDTAHLEPLEDLCYRRLLDFYYSSEAAIPLETESVSRRLRLGSEVVSKVLNEFFEKRETGWHHGRCDAEIARYQAQVERARQNGKRGGRPQNQREKPTRLKVGSDNKPNPNPELTGSKANQNQEPRTNNTTSNDVVGRIASRSPQLADAEWLKSLADDPAYAGINVTTEFGKMQRWCEANRKMPSRRRFVNWLNRAEKPMAGAGTRPAPKHAAYDAATATAGRTADEILNF